MVTCSHKSWLPFPMFIALILEIAVRQPELNCKNDIVMFSVVMFIVLTIASYSLST